MEVSAYPTQRSFAEYELGVFINKKGVCKMNKIQISEFDADEVERYQPNLFIPHIKEPVPRLIKDVFDELHVSTVPVCRRHSWLA